MSVVSRLKSALRPLWQSLHRVDPIKAQIAYLLAENSEIRQQLRMLLAASPEYRAAISQTADSFDSQWADLPTGRHLPGDPEFDETSIDQLCRYTEKPRDWFTSKRVLDAGCGMGRWSRALCILGAEVTAIDISQAGLASTESLCSTFPGFRTKRCNLLEPLPFGDFDLVWNYGVCHHTGDTRLALGHVAAAVKEGGLLFTMLYGEPRDGQTIDYGEIASYTKHRQATSAMSFSERVAYLRARFPDDEVHGWFDAISPRVNDLYRFDEIEGWLRSWGFTNIHTTVESRNLHIAATHS